MAAVATLQSNWAQATTCPAGAQAVSAASSAATVSQVSPSPAEASSSSGSTSDDSPPAGTVGITSTLSSTIRPSSSRRATNRRCRVSVVW